MENYNKMNCQKETYGMNCQMETYGMNCPMETNGMNCQMETHSHEVQGSVRLAEEGCDAHNHRFATISGQTIPVGQGNHVHEVKFDTDTYEGHHHEFCGRTSCGYPICGGHVHYLESMTSKSDGHCHCFRVITHIEDPIED